MRDTDPISATTGTDNIRAGRTFAGRGECKTPNGKLVAVSVRLAGNAIGNTDGNAIADVRSGDGIIALARLDGDFLIDDIAGIDDAAGGDDMTLIADVERVIMRQRAPIDVTRFNNDVSHAIKAHPRSELIGTTADAIVTAAARAIADALIAMHSENGNGDGGVNGDGGDTGEGWSSDRGATPWNARKSKVSEDAEASEESSRSVSPDIVSSSDEKAANVPVSGTNVPLSGRWRDLSDLAPSVILDPEPYTPAMQMALDQTIAQAVAAGEQPPILRFWNWGGPAVVIGAYQSVEGEVDEAEAEREGFTVVRRITGGGAMFVRPDDTITYSLYVPESFTHGLDPVESYRLCDEWAFAALHAMGIPAVHQPINDIATPSGGKIGGAAQRRFPGSHARPGCILHHVTMAYRIDTAAMSRILRISKEKLKFKAVASASKRVQPLATQTDMTREQIVDGMLRYALAAIPGAHPDTLPKSLLTQAHSLAETKFTTPTWTHRIP
ncbi:lipoate--protein ligase family protein [Bifidobacterium callimiconis]|uniref:Lipoate-protein ligase A n=1 Tax=Bifidobacterium callimiconis TaxID=2306973 RepID=A0A430FEA3_9BIFI|nr:biotin/lipoate A/B protein ligase family protein [Bifidobacterium callimiconis]RSX51173.1 lipoate-protein ligase A [Bifidobacterium callimiconis]